MALNPDPRLLAAIRRAPAHLRVPLLTTALIESGGRLNAVGDGGASHGPYQMHDGGRGARTTVAQERDPVFSTNAAAREFQQFYDMGARGASLAYRAQRPADQADYMAKYNKYDDQARALLGGAQQPYAVGGSGEAASAGMNIPPQIINAVRSGRPLSNAAFMQLARQLAAGGAQQSAPMMAGAPAVGPGGVVPILPGEPEWGSYGYGDPEGQGGKHLAVDWFGEHGTPAVSPFTGRIVRVTPHRSQGPVSGQVYGGVLSIRRPDGTLGVMRHIDPLGFRVGQTVRAGQRVGTPTNWSGADHIHFETYRRGSSDREYGPRYAFNPRELYR